ncbi:MAG: DUF2240 family protein [Thermoplasmata archaeon]|nr:DUF2240 family protein [Thermoplasmata archaeon]
MSELQVALAQVFRKKGKSSMPENDFVFAVSLDFRWFTPKEAQKLLELGLDSELLAMKDGIVSPTFDFKATEIPKGYSPAPELILQNKQPRGLFLKIVDMISQSKNLPTKDVISQINQTQDRMSVDIEVAALVVAKNFELDVSKYLDLVEEEIGKRYKQ